MSKKIIFDVDDILWSLNKRMTDKAGLIYENQITFRTEDNPLLTTAQKEKAMTILRDNTTFENIKWHDGIERINNIPADIYINSNSLSQETADTKRKQLHDVLNIPDDHMTLNVTVSASAIKQKKIDNDTFIFVDDSPHNLSMSTAKYNIALIRPWNTSNIGKTIIKESNRKVIYCESLNKIIDTINMILKKEEDFYEYINLH